MGSLDPAKILVVLVVALIVLGPERLPRVARQAGAAWRELTRVREEVAEELRSALPDKSELPVIPRIPSVKGTLSRYITETPETSIGASPAVPNGDGAGGDLSSAGATTQAAGVVGEFVPPADDPSMN
ncbi:MAG TPA: twin-arginine translocase TatA/TatE family subunit [Acidimicrobiales bacterium]|nr:twin-arginine translocase TatA/TatE family subunit [Acidimicrobiales bacterium]